MSEPTYTPGRVVWRELMTDDIAKAKGFYGELFGWTWKDMPMGEGQPAYPIAQVGDKGIGGMMQKPKDAPFPPFWLSYVSVKDVDASCASAKDGGGSVQMPPMDIPEVGRLAVISDFAGAAIGLLRSSRGDQPQGMPRPGEFCWETLSTPDVERAKSFYSRAIGWKAGAGTNGIPTFGTGGDSMEAQVADIQKAENMPPMWMTYVVVEKLEPSRDRVAKLGGKVAVPLIEVPNVGRIAVIADPTGGHLGLFEPNMQGMGG